MTDQVRREESAESELQHPLLDAGDAPAAQSEAATPEQTAGAAAQPTPETTAGAPEAVMVEPSATTPVTAETTATPVTPAMPAEDVTVVAGASGEGDTELATATPPDGVAAETSLEGAAEQGAAISLKRLRRMGGMWVRQRQTLRRPQQWRAPVSCPWLSKKRARVS